MSREEMGEMGMKKVVFLARIFPFWILLENSRPS